MLALLRRRLRRGRDQQHLLSHARARRCSPAGPSRRPPTLPLRAQGAAADHAPAAPEGRRRAGARVRRDAARRSARKRGPLLFQLPPNLKADLPRLDDLPRPRCPPGIEPAFEFRHESWFQDDTWALLRAHGAALCIAQTDDLETPLVATAPFGYVAPAARGLRPPASWRTGRARLRAVDGWRAGLRLPEARRGGRAPALARAFLEALG